MTHLWRMQALIIISRRCWPCADRHTANKVCTIFPSFAALQQRSRSLKSSSLTILLLAPPYAERMTSSRITNSYLLIAASDLVSIRRVRIEVEPGAAKPPCDVPKRPAKAGEGRHTITKMSDKSDYLRTSNVCLEFRSRLAPFFRCRNP
ncbi:hypothetical protein MESS4_120149 [Mesorhizobium sp. STM 4661]|nr:hypothetical protein MESS4_120149 [Mesorhizobium sp. STM 4661]